MTDWYRDRPFRVAFVASLLIHAALIALIPGFRAVVFEPSKVLDVEIIVPEPPPAPTTTERSLPPPQRIVEETPLQPEPKVEPPPEPLLRQPEPEPPPIPRAEIAPPPAPVVVPKAEPRIEPKSEITPEPKIEPRPEPPPVARVEPLPEPRTEILPDQQPVPRVEPPPPVEQATVPPAPVVATPVPPPAPPQPVARKKEPDRAVEPRLLLTYGLSISNEIKRYQKYPPMAQRKGWEGTAEVLLQIDADGKVTRITLGKSSGRSVLDEEALNMVRKASPLPPAPQDLRGRELTVTVPIVFKLQS
ncbi:MAG TPA: TonB family protein [Burkholderiales bacterium]|nr:TonB family protein [Burkholderiales bacterium]